MNTPDAVRRASKAAGFSMVRLTLTDTSAMTVLLGPIVILEPLWIRLCRWEALKNVRTNMIAILRSPAQMEMERDADSAAALRVARQKAAAASVEHACCFATPTKEAADVIVSLDAFEHYQDPSSILRTMRSVLKLGGEVLVSFGPPWRHPLGGHSFSVFPWAHLVFSEEAVLRWRATFKHDGATRFHEVSGGLNHVTIKRFEKLVAESPFQFADFELTPIRKLRTIHNRWIREFTPSLVRCRLDYRSLNN